MLDVRKLVDECLGGSKIAQKKLYEEYAPTLMGICMRYSGVFSEAEDILQESFLKIFSRLESYSGRGSLAGWMRRIVVNTAISMYHKDTRHRSNYDFDSIQESEIYGSRAENIEFTRQELMEAMSHLSSGYRLIFNLYAVEGYKHREIAEMLEIEENTSKSQYSRARRLIQNVLQQMSKVAVAKSRNYE